MPDAAKRLWIDSHTHLFGHTRVSEADIEKIGSGAAIRLFRPSEKGLRGEGEFHG